jgi:hypothetical protein
MDADALLNCCLVCSHWLNLIGNSLHTYTKIPLRIDYENYKEVRKTNERYSEIPKFNFLHHHFQITANNMLRQYKTKLVFSGINFQKIADNHYIHQLIQTAEEIHFLHMKITSIRSILEICRHVSKVLLGDSQLDSADEDNPCGSSRIKRMKLDTVVLESSTVDFDVDFDVDVDLLQVFQELAIVVQSIDITVNYDGGFAWLEEMLSYIEGAYGSVLTGLTILKELKEPHFTELVDYLIELPNLRLRTFSTHDKNCDTQLMRLIDHQPFITNLHLEPGENHLALLQYAVEKMPQLETLKMSHKSTTEELNFLFDSLNSGKFKHMKHLHLAGYMKETREFSFLNELHELESLVGFPSCGGELIIPKLTQPLKMLKNFTCQEVRMTDENLQEIFKNMQNLEEFSFELIRGVSAEFPFFR